MKAVTSSRLMALALAACLAPCAQAQSSVTIYGLLDLSMDSVHKTEGNVQGTIFGLSGFTPVPNSVAAPSSTVTRIASSLTGQSHFGFKGVEDLGGGWKGKFQLEGGLIPDTGELGADGRIFGRMAWVGLTTPAGEFRLGRQAAPMLTAYYVNTLESLGTTDLIGGGVTVNNLQIFQDNVVSYTLQSGGWLAQLSYSPNAGVASRVSAARSQATATTPPASETSGQILGGATAGAETNSGRGRTSGAMAAYIGESWRVVGAYHHNNFGVPAGLAPLAGGYVPLFNLQSFQSFMLGGVYKFSASGTEFAVNYHQGQFQETGSLDPKVVTWAAAAKQSLGNVDLIAQFALGRFTNFTQGSDKVVMLGADYNLSKRTALYVRAGQAKDDRGNVVRSTVSNAPLAGGPATLLLPFGSVEVPLFSGAGATADATTRLIGVGVRHEF